MADTDTVVLTREAYEGLLCRVEDAEDRALIAERRNDPTLSMENMQRLLAGEHPLAVWREEKGMSREHLAEAAGLSPSAVEEIEQESCVPSIETARKLCAALGLSLDDLFG